MERNEDDEMTDIDLSVKFGRMAFKNPVLPGPSEICCDAKTVARCIKSGCGGIMLKTYTHISALRRRAVPTFAFGDHIGSEYKGILFHGAGADPRSPEYICEKEMPELRKLCNEAGVPLIASIMASAEPEKMAELSSMFYEAGADGIEVNSGCGIGDQERWKSLAKQLELSPEQTKIGFAAGRDFALVKDMIKAIKSETHTNFPVTLKIHAMMEPIEIYARGWAEAGADGLSAVDGFGQCVIIDPESESQYFGCWTTGGTTGTSALRYVSLGKIVRIKETIPDLYVSGIGGIRKGEHAVQYLLAGCSTVQIATAIFYYGYNVFIEVLDGIASWMDRKGYSNINEFRGKALKSFGVPTGTFVEYGTPLQYIPQVNMDKCNLCGVCQDRCLWECIKVDKKRRLWEVSEKECWNCAICIGVCPRDALVLVDKETKKVVWNNKGQAVPHRPRELEESSRKKEMQ